MRPTDDATDICDAWLTSAKMIGLTVRASGPQWLVDAVITALADLGHHRTRTHNRYRGYAFLRPAAGQNMNDLAEPA